MRAEEVLQQLNFGNSVAEFDGALERYFVETNTFRLLVRGEADIIAGDKGTGKTALFLILRDRYTRIAELSDTEVVPAFNPTGSPVFQRLLEDNVQDEGQYIYIWKAYILSLIGNWALDLVIDNRNDDQEQLHNLLQRLDLRSVDDSPVTVFSRVINLFRRLSNPKSIEAGVTISPHGMPIVIPKVEFGDPLPPAPPGQVTFEEAMALLNKVLAGIDVSVWVVFDRLDEAFQGAPVTEVPALRALFRTYLDLIPYDRLRIKLFVRRDLFRRIIGDGFVNLTHINARKIEITWDEDDLWDLLKRRIAESPEFLARTGLRPDEMNQIWSQLVPQQVDPGSRKPQTWTWIMRRIRDGNDVHPPRNLIDLLKKAQAVQLRKEEREHREYPVSPLITPDSLKHGLSMLSDERVQDTLLAEAGAVAPLIELFRGGKAEHDEESLGAVFGLEGVALSNAIKSLTDMGFLERIGTSYKVPSLYRDGLLITQGKAFGANSAVQDDDE